VMAAELQDWYSGLWHGKNLAYTLVFLSGSGSLTCFVLARLRVFPISPGASRGIES
jgi:hypothetical protein